MKTASLQDLLTDQLKDLYSAETQIAQALPKMAEAASADDLKQGFYLHLEQTREHAARLEQACQLIGEKPTGKKCEATAGLVKEGDEAMKEDASPQARDVMLIAAAQRVEHYEIAGYTCALQLARALALEEIILLLSATLTEERTAEDRLTQASYPAIGRVKKATSTL